MIGYVTLGTNDLARASKFYDALLAGIGGKRVIELERAIVWMAGSGGPGLTVCEPFDGKAATVGNGTMVAFKVESQDKVTALHSAALALGGTDEGAPGARTDDFFAAYFRDLDGNKLAAFYTATFP